MTFVQPLADLRTSPTVALFEGRRHAGVELSFYDTTWKTGRGPALHLHPYPEVFLVEAGEATFVVDGDEVVAGSGHVVVVPANTPHRFENRAAAPLRVLSLHPNGEVLQTAAE